MKNQEINEYLAERLFGWRYHWHISNPGNKWWEDEKYKQHDFVIDYITNYQLVIEKLGSDSDEVSNTQTLEFELWRTDNQVTLRFLDRGYLTEVKGDGDTIGPSAAPRSNISKRRKARGNGRTCADERVLVG